MFIFNQKLGILLLPYFIALVVFSLIVGFSIYLIRKDSPSEKHDIVFAKNPLELKIALLFALLFVFFSFLTYFTIQFYGNVGLDILSYIVGFTDIDPYLLNLLQGDYDIGLKLIATASLQAIISNNILKMIYTSVLADKKTKKLVLLGLGLITLFNIGVMIIL
jgi:uncharacterized membrane protein (DUF4010 family)